MPSGKRARQQRQAAVPRPPAGGARRPGARQASPRTLAIAGGVIVLVIIAVVLAIVLSKGSSSSSSNGSYDGPTIHAVIGNGIPAIGNSKSGTALNSTTVAHLLTGIPQHGLELGNPNAPVTLTEFIDLQCPDCQQFELTELAPIIDKYVRPGKLKIEMKPWAILDRPGSGIVDSHRGQKATIAASFQNKAFNFAEVLYYNQQPEDTGWMNDAAISRIAAGVDGLNLQKLATDANSSQTASIVQSVDSEANTLQQRFPPNGVTGFGGTPGIFLSKGTGPLVLLDNTSGVPQLSALEAAINKLLP